MSTARTPDGTPHCGVRWPNLGPAGGNWTCTLDDGHDGWHEARGPGGRKLASPSAEIPQDHPDLIEQISEPFPAAQETLL